jgi:alkanesulfonate monooxygenase SsuD/methylene tetrahydromethanopterin reductase-like flavin-dependent oxidoreductase (luciferase family)
MAERMKAVHARAAAHGRTLDYGLRVHVIVRDTEAEATRVCRATWSRNSMTTRAGDPRAGADAIAGRGASGAQRANWPTTSSAMSSRICGPASAARARAAARRWSARSIR